MNYLDALFSSFCLLLQTDWFRVTIFEEIENDNNVQSSKKNQMDARSRAPPTLSRVRTKSIVIIRLALASIIKCRVLLCSKHR